MPRSSHYHLSKRSPRQPSPLVARLIYIVAVAEPMANLPQIYTIFAHHTAVGVSLTSWLLYAGFAASWLAYGVSTRQRPMMIGAGLILVTDLCVVEGTILYGGTF